MSSTSATTNPPPAASRSKYAPKPPIFSDKLKEREFVKFRLAQAFRIFGKHGFDEGISGHLTCRDPVKPDCFWVNPWGLHFKLVQPKDLLLVDHSGNVLDESGPNRLLNAAAYMIHSSIHAARPDVMCAAHSHSTYGKAFSSLGIPLDPISQDSCAFYNDHVVYDNFQGIIDDHEEGEAITKALGPHKAAILVNHGILVASQSIEAAVFFYMSLEKCCRVQLLADSAAGGIGRKTHKIDPDSAALTGKRNGSAMAGWFSGLGEFQLLEKEEGVSFSFDA